MTSVSVLVPSANKWHLRKKLIFRHLNKLVTHCISGMRQYHCVLTVELLGTSFYTASLQVGHSGSALPVSYLCPDWRLQSYLERVFRVESNQRDKGENFLRRKLRTDDLSSIHIPCESHDQVDHQSLREVSFSQECQGKEGNACSTRT